MATMATDFDMQTKELYAALEAHDLEKMLSLHTDDVFYEEVIADGPFSRGKEGLRTQLQGMFAAMPDVKMELISSFACGDRQCEESIMSGTQTGSFRGLPASGKSFSVRVVTVRELKENKTSRISFYYDSASFMRQLGA